MIYKIPLNEISSFSKVIEKIEDIGEFIYSNKVFYLHTNFDIPSIIKFIGQQDSNIIEVINAQNYQRENSSFVVNWCFNNLLKDKTKEFEDSEEGQKKIKYLIDYLDTLEKIRKEGVDTSANRKEKDGKENK